ncbi:polymer-forming cytoskeletal protein [Parvularcula sp. IMCC14364]|uniref:bactofilin family protein n=1 Tax=Parvularcula sp. IMCC14364 TaxID=3067902 RepID=UPI002740938F|nr:polymer-forming cytoskeletal protein [Parvularcula sp. IMCC14364]
MFSKAKKNQDVTSELVEIGDTPDRTPARPPASKAQQKSSSRMSGNNRRAVPRATGVPSLISGDVIIKGVVEAEGEVQFDGILEGDIRAKGLVIGEGAAVKGEVVADKVKVSGTIEGAIRAGHVELSSSAHVKGDILHSALSIENGARFDGNCRHSDDPMSDSSAARAKATPKPAVTKPVAAMAAVEAAPAQETEPMPAELENSLSEAASQKPALVDVNASAAVETDQRQEAEEAQATVAKKVQPSQGSSFLSRGGKSDLR